MGKVRKQTTRLLDKDAKYLTARLDDGNYSPSEILGAVLMDLYDVKRLSGDAEFQEAHSKVWGVMEAVRKRGDELSQHAYATYFKVYQGLCQELNLDERPVYATKPAQQPVSASKTENESQTESQTEQSAKNDGQLLTRDLSRLILGIGNGELKPRDFLREGLDELGDLVSEIPFPKTRFSRARQIYANVMDFLGTSGIYGNVESCRQEYNALLERVDGCSQKKSKSDSAGIGRTALAPAKDPTKNFRKTLSK